MWPAEKKGWKQLSLLLLASFFEEDFLYSSTLVAVAIRKENFVGREEGWLLNGGGKGESSQHGRRKQKKPSDVAGRGREGENIISLPSPHQKKEGDDFFPLSLSFRFPLQTAHTK